MVINHKVTHTKLTLAMGSVSADFALQFELSDLNGSNGFEKISLQQALTINQRGFDQMNTGIQLNLFEF